MGDIVDRLRNSIGNVLLEREAAWEIESLRTQLSAATAALEAAQKDAERFQWWFGVGNDERVSGLVRAEMVRVDDPEAETVLLTLDQWREAIDAARREGGGES